MTKLKFAGAVLRAAVAIGMASGGVAAASAQTGNTMGNMQMAPGSKMDMKTKATPKPTHHKKAKHRHHKAAAK